MLSFKQGIQHCQKCIFKRVSTTNPWKMGFKRARPEVRNNTDGRKILESRNILILKSAEVKIKAEEQV